MGSPAPKPAPKAKKPRRPLLSEKPIKRSGKIKPKPRKPSEFRRIYGSKARVEWVKSLPCIVPRCRRASENAHVENGGTGRKADADKIAPICRGHHRYELHRHGRLWFEMVYNIDLEIAAAETEAKWQARLRVSGTPE